MGQFKSILKKIKKYANLAEIKLAWLALILFSIIFLIGLLFAPFFFKITITIVFLIGFIIFIKISLKTAQNIIETETKNKELESIISDFDAAIVGYDLDFKITAFNKAAEKIFGINSQQIVGQQLKPDFIKKPQFKRLAQIIFPSLAPIINQISEPNTWPQIVDITLEEPYGEFRTFLIRVLDKKNEPVKFFKIIRDRTREKTVLRSKSEFISVAAHQIRTPLSAINWTFETLINSVTDSNLKKIVQNGYEASQRASKVVNDLLDVSRIEEGKFGYNFEEVNLYEFIKNILVSFKTIAEQYQVQLYFKTINEKLIVRIDPQKLAIAFSNLIDNAIRYNIKNGKVEVFVEKTMIKQQPFAKITIKDTGVGIPPSEIEKLFRKFYRGSNVVHLEPNGSGLGLYIAKNIIQQHGGEINVESILNRGSTFSFTLPLNFSLIPNREIIYEEEI